MIQTQAASDEARAPKVFIFLCNSQTYLSCIEKSVFGSDKSWPLQIGKGDYCLLHHYDAGALFGLWKAEVNGGRNLVPKAWNGKFPYQVKVALVSPGIVEVPKHLITEMQIDLSTGRFDSIPEGRIAERIIASMERGQ